MAGVATHFGKLFEEVRDQFNPPEKLGGAEVAQLSKDGHVLVISGNGGKTSGNEDCAAAQGKGKNWRLATADGIGSGLTLSALAAKRACDAFTNLRFSTFAEAAQSAHQAILQLAVSRPVGIGAQNVGCVLAAASVNEDSATLANLGDSRWIHVRGSRVLDYSEDDVVSGSSVVRSGISARDTEDLSRFGLDQLRRVTLQKGDLLFLFSDGLHHGGIDFDKEVCAGIEDVFNSGERQSQDVLAHRIKERLTVLARNKSRDNISLVIYCHGQKIVDAFKNRAVEVEQLRAAEAARIAGFRALVEGRDAPVEALSSCRLTDGCELNAAGTLLTLIGDGEQEYQDDLALVVERGGKPVRLMAIDGITRGGYGNLAAGIVADHFSKPDPHRDGRELLLPQAAAQQAKAALHTRFEAEYAEIERTQFPGHTIGRPGAVCVVADLSETEWVLSWTGDARGFVVRDDKLVALTGDNYTVPNPGEDLDAFEARLNGKKTPLVTSAICATVNPELDRHQIRHVPQRGDLLFLMTDGAHEVVNSKDLMRILEEEILKEGEATPWQDRIFAKIRGLNLEVDDNFTAQIHCHGMSIEEFFRERAAARTAVPSPTTVAATPEPEPAPTPVSVASEETPPPAAVTPGVRFVSLPRALGTAALVGCGSLMFACGGITCSGVGLAGAVALGREVASLPWGEWLKGQLDSKTFWDPVCDQAIRGEWTLASGSNGGLATLTEYAGKTVTVTVEDPNGRPKVRLENIPAECLAGGAPRAVAAEKPVNVDRVGIQDGAVINYYHFKAFDDVGALSNRARSSELKIENDGEVWLSCFPVSEGCQRDWAVLDGRK